MPRAGDGGGHVQHKNLDETPALKIPTLSGTSMNPSEDRRYRAKAGQPDHGTGVGALARRGRRRSPPHALRPAGKGHAQPEDPDRTPAGTILTAPLLHLLSYFR